MNQPTIGQMIGTTALTLKGADAHITNEAGQGVSLEGGAGNGTGAKGQVNVKGLVNAVGPTAVLITAATELKLADSGGVFTIDQDAAFDIDLPSPTVGPGLRFTFVIHDAGAANVTITVLGAAATFIGTIINDVTSVIPCTGSTITLAASTAAVGDSIEIISLATDLYLVRAVTSTASGITIA